jgi:hypothetical protein
VPIELETQEAIFYEEESVTLHRTLFEKCLKKLVLERVNSKGKRFQGKDIDFYLNGVPPSRIAKIHKVTSDSLEVSVDEMEGKNARLKERIK